MIDMPRMSPLFFRFATNLPCEGHFLMKQYAALPQKVLHRRHKRISHTKDHYHEQQCLLNGSPI